jgi:hypothetical protein
MAFATGCQNAEQSKRPIVYLVDRFVAGPQQAEAELPRLSQYPADTLRVFRQTIERNLALLQIPKGGPLFHIKSVRALADVPGFARGVPGFLGGGDVVLCLAHLPPYTLSEGTLLVPPTTPLDGILARILASFRANFDAEWRAKADPSSALPAPDSGALRRDALEGKAGISQATIINNATIKVKGTKATRLVYYNARVGIIDVGYPAAEGVFVWPSRVQGKVLKILARSAIDQPDASFGPLAVSWVKQNLDPKVKEESKPETVTAFLEAVGRGLAYGLLHEFWHVSERTGDHPYGTGNNLIEGSAKATNATLQFHPEAVKKMLAGYEATWCKFLTEGRVAIGEV